MNWDGSVAGVAGGDRLRFENLSRNRDVSDSTASNTGTTSSSTRTSGITTESSSSISRPSASGDGSGTSVVPPKRPFAKVDGIVKESPAESAGMKVGDLVTLFGTLHAQNNDRLRALAKLVPQVAAERGTIQLVVLRRLSSSHNTNYDDENKWETLTLSLRPRPFSGRGLLGCHIIPFD
jgi:C-terminal processing protease CtpA/Prc